MKAPLDVVYVILYFYLIASVATLETENLEVKSNIGLIRGLKAVDGDYSMFLGVPYARVNKTNPFGESLPHPHFETPFEAHDDTAMCPQQEEFNDTIVGNLDCLKLNIYVPNSNRPTTGFPVLVYIYGGNFRIGFGGRYLYGPKYLVRHGITLVTFNYRVGPYGFLCANTPQVPGNQGYKDQVTALKWIRDNIADFGGDPEQVTVSGHSFGAVSVAYILYSLSGKEKLFDKVIFQSMSSYSHEPLKESPGEEIPLQIAKYLGYNTENVAEALSYMSTVDSDIIIAATVNLSTPYGDCVETKFDGVENFMSDLQINLKLPAVKDMPILIGNTDRESLMTYYTLKALNKLDNFNPFYKAIVLFDMDNDYRLDMENIIHRAYTSENKITDRSKNEWISFTTDFFYLHVTKRSIDKFILNGAGNVFYYVFSYNGGRNFIKNKNKIVRRGAVHGDELGYIYDISFMNENPTPRDQLTIDRMTAMWANFVKYGDPTPTTSELLPVKWKPYTNEDQHYMNIDSELSLQTSPFHKNMAFWDLFYKLNGRFQRGYREYNDSNLK